MRGTESHRSKVASTPVRRLPDALVDQIAAGEVVERPASVVKELVENALDADAGRVRIDVREGGAALMAVTDDGRGMSPDDARLALERHATSKIGRIDDLDGIATFGFRGEALPSIASVSRLRLTTRRPADEAGVELLVEAGRVVSERAAGCPAGTRIEVADLFAAVPARRKFLKRPATEWGHIADWLARCALTRPDVHFEVQRDERPAWVWPAVREPLDRIAAVLSEEEAAALVAADVQQPGARLEAYVSRPDHTRRSASGIHLFVDGRPVRDRLLRHALLEAYRDVLPRGRFPTAILFLEVEAGGVDVNVHPAKWEVRFADPRAIHALVRRAVRQALSSRAWLGAAGGRSEAGRVAEAPAARSDGGFAFAPTARGAEAATPDSVGLPSESPSAEPGVHAGPGAAATAPARFGELRLLGQLLASYLVAEGKEGLLLIDQHAAHERVLYERLRAEWADSSVASQRLLLPVSLQLEPAAVAALDAAGPATLRLGFELERFGEDAVVVRAVPALLSARDPASLVRELADEWGASDAGGATSARAAVEARSLEAADRLFASLACHAARRAGEHLEIREQRALMDALDAIPWAPTCPHGRPVVLPIDRTEIERRFGRR